MLLLGSVFMAVPIRVAFRRCGRTGCARTPYLPLVLSLPCCWWSCLCTQQWSPTSAPLANADAFRGHRLKIILVNPKHAAMLTLELGASTVVSGVDAKLGWESKGASFLEITLSTLNDPFEESARAAKRRLAGLGLPSLATAVV